MEFEIAKKFLNDFYKTEKPIDDKHICPNCNNRMELIEFLTCTNCGATDFDYYEKEDGFIVHTKKVHRYKRYSHFQELLNRLQCKEMIRVPDDVLNNIVEPFTRASIKKQLKLMNKQKYYEFIEQIYCEKNKTQPFRLTAQEEHEITNMFLFIQSRYNQHKIKGRKNFLSYAFTLKKLCEIVGRNDVAESFRKLNNTKKLKQHEIIFQNLIKDYGLKKI